MTKVTHWIPWFKTAHLSLIFDPKREFPVAEKIIAWRPNVQLAVDSLRLGTNLKLSMLEISAPCGSGEHIVC